MIVLVEVARVEKVGSLEKVGSSGKVSLLEKVVLVLLAVETCSSTVSPKLRLRSVLEYLSGCEHRRQ
jgi:hypothetical protein